MKWFLTPLVSVLAGCMTWSTVRAESMGCLVEPDRVADVGSQSVGVLERLMVERGDKVNTGQVLARLSAQVERASVSVAEARSQADAEVRQAMAAYELAQRKLERARDLLKQDFVSDQALDQADAEARVAEQRVVQAREAQRVAQREYRLSTAQLGQRDVRSPFDGIVIERYRTEGERIEREPVVRVARIDPLRVEAIMPAAQFGSVTPGQTAVIRTDLPAFSTLNAKVVLVDRVIDPASNSFRVRLTLPNPDHRIPAGLRCKVDFGGVSASSAQPPAAPPVAPPTGGARLSRTPVAPAVPALPPNRVTPAPVARDQVPATPARSPGGGAAAPSVRNAALGVALHSTQIVPERHAPERAITKQYMASREPRLQMANAIALPRRSAIDEARPLLSLR